MELAHKDQRRPLSFPNLDVVVFLDRFFKRVRLEISGGGGGGGGGGKNFGGLDLFRKGGFFFIAF